MESVASRASSSFNLLQASVEEVEGGEDAVAPLAAYRRCSPYFTLSVVVKHLPFRRQINVSFHCDES